MEIVQKKYDTTTDGAATHRDAVGDSNASKANDVPVC